MLVDLGCDKEEANTNGMQMKPVLDIMAYLPFENRIGRLVIRYCIS